MNEMIEMLKKVREYLFERYKEERDNYGDPERAWFLVADIDNEIVRLELEMGKVPCMRVFIFAEELEEDELEKLGYDEDTECINAVWEGDIDEYFELRACDENMVLINGKYEGIVYGMFADDVDDTYQVASRLERKGFFW